MRGKAVETERQEERRRPRYRVLLGLVPLALLVAAIAPSPAAADPQFEEGCRAQLTGEEGSNEATFTFRCANHGVSEVNVQANKDFLFLPPALQGDQGGGFVCLANASDEWTCEGEADEDENVEGTMAAQDVCGTEDNEPLVVDVTLTPDPSNGNVEFSDLQIQCEPPPDGNGDGDGDGDGGGGGDDDGATPQGGVDSGAGGTAGGGVSDALLPVGLGLILVGTLGLGALALARRRA